MKKRFLQRVAGLLLTGLWLVAASINPIMQVAAEKQIRTVILDPGHGGTDGGAVAEDGTLEKDLNLTIALLLKECLEEKGIAVLMTRQTDEDTDGLTGFHKKHDLEERAMLGNSGGADLYISIHVNASPSRNDQGFQVWYGTGNQQGCPLAETVTKAVSDLKICTRIREVKEVPSSLYIFRTVTIPSILVECGFISNAADLNKLKQETFRKALCEGICKGICDYLSGNNSRIT